LWQQQRRHAEEQREHDDLGHVTPGERGEHVIGNEAEEHFGDAGYLPEGRLDLLGQLHPNAGSQQVHRHEPQRQRQGRRQDVVGDDLAAQPAQGANVAEAGHSGQQVEEDQRDDRHHEEPDEQVSQRLHYYRTLASGQADDDAYRHEQEDLHPQRQPAVALVQARTRL
jgi:hypothetical protein